MIQHFLSEFLQVSLSDDNYRTSVIIVFESIQQQHRVLYLNHRVSVETIDCYWNVLELPVQFFGNLQIFLANRIISSAIRTIETPWCGCSNHHK